MKPELNPTLLTPNETRAESFWSSGAPEPKKHFSESETLILSVAWLKDEDQAAFRRHLRHGFRDGGQRVP